MGFSPDTFSLPCLNGWRMWKTSFGCLLVLVTYFETCSI
uniref:Uncharacterized protein n=1 Tax=Manihot esculenta TaxID=3983 RepID=A0A2C9VRN6_MANES